MISFLPESKSKKLNKNFMKIPDKNKLPEIGFYYHYKHDDANGINDYAYQILGTGVHTEDDCRDN